MAGAEATTDTKKERALRTRCKKYGISVDFYNRLGEKQGWRCGICGRHQREFTVSLNIDHEHFRVLVQKLGASWHGNAAFKNGSCTPLIFAKTKAELVRNIKTMAMPLSVRGLLCPGRYAGCNRLMGRVDDIPWLEHTLAYLKNTPASQLETKLSVDNLLEL